MADRHGAVNQPRTGLEKEQNVVVTFITRTETRLEMNADALLCLLVV